MVGPLSIKDAIKPLPPDLEEFVSNSGGHGFIIVSFGSNVASILQKPVVDMLATAFGKLKQRVVWRLKGISTVSHMSIETCTLPSLSCKLSRGLKAIWSRGVARIFQRGRGAGVTLCSTQGTYIVHCRLLVLSTKTYLCHVDPSDSLFFTN